MGRAVAVAQARKNVSGDFSLQFLSPADAMPHLDAPPAQIATEPAIPPAKVTAAEKPSGTGPSRTEITMRSSQLASEIAESSIHAPGNRVRTEVAIGSLSAGETAPNFIALGSVTPGPVSNQIPVSSAINEASYQSSEGSSEFSPGARDFSQKVFEEASGPSGSRLISSPRLASDTAGADPAFISNDRVGISELLPGSPEILLRTLQDAPSDSSQGGMTSSSAQSLSLESSSPRFAKAGLSPSALQNVPAVAEDDATSVATFVLPANGSAGTHSETMFSTAENLFPEFKSGIQESGAALSAREASNRIQNSTYTSSAPTPPSIADLNNVPSPPRAMAETFSLERSAVPARIAASPGGKQAVASTAAHATNWREVAQAQSSPGEDIQASVGSQTPFSIFFSDSSTVTASAASALTRAIVPGATDSNMGVALPNGNLAVTTDAQPQSSASAMASKVSAAGSTKAQASAAAPDAETARAPGGEPVPVIDASPADIPHAVAGAPPAPTSPPPTIGSESLPGQPSTRQAKEPTGLPSSAASLPRPVVEAAHTEIAQLAQIVSRATQAEMRIGLQTSAFGNVEVRTVVRTSDVGLVIGSEKGDLHSLLVNELPAVASNLQQQNLRLASVSFASGFAFSNNSGSGANPQERPFAPPRIAAGPQYGELPAEEFADPPPLAPWTGNSNLSILA